MYILQTVANANRAKAQGIDIYTVAIGDNPDMGEMNGIASDPDSQYMVRLATSDEVPRAADDLLTLLCT